MEKQSRLLIKLSEQLFKNKEDREQFINALLQPQNYPTSILWCQEKPEKLPFNIEQSLPWQPKLLLSNEVIGKRVGMLFTNLKRCQISPSYILSLDSEKLAQLIPNSTQVVLVDATCSGQSLIAKGIKALGCFHPITIKNNANRQKRIIANSAKIVANQGYLAYMTCTYSPQENEKIIEWFLKQFPYFQPVNIPHLSNYQSTLVDFPCYRIFPHSGLGAGAFSCLLHNQLQGDLNLLSDDFLTEYTLKKV
jgi:16S rRNA C967 or C1407 C5-methylase (RsmB/RsmF family)